MTTQAKTTAPRLKTRLLRGRFPFNLKHAFYGRAIIEAFIRLDPRQQMRNPVMFVAMVGSVLTTILFIWMLLGKGDKSPAIAGTAKTWLWLTVLFVNFAQALAGGHGQARTEALRRTHRQSLAKKLYKAEYKDDYEIIPATSLRWGDVVLVEAGDIIPTDGEVVEGVALVDESALTGKQVPLVREAGRDCIAVTGGTRVLSDWLVIRIKAKPGGSLLDRMFNLVEETKHRPPPCIAFLNILLASAAIIFFLATLAWLVPLRYDPEVESPEIFITLTSLITLLVALSPTTTGGLLSIVNLAGQDRLLQHNIIALRNQTLERAGKVDVLLLDKSIAIVPGYRQAVTFIPLNKTNITQLAEVARLASLADGTPEGESIIALAEKQLGLGHQTEGILLEAPAGAHVFSYSAETGLSGIEVNGMSIRQGAPQAVMAYLQAHGHPVTPELNGVVERITGQGGVPLVLTVNGQAIGVIHLRNVVNQYLKERLIRLRRMGLKTVMITDDTSLVAAAIAAEAGMDDFLASATAETKLALIRRYRASGQRVAMTGHGINDASVLIEADVAVAMNAGAQPARETANLVDLDSNPTKLVELVELSQQQQMTRRALALFSLTYDVAKYLVLIPSVFASIYPALGVLNLMRLSTPASAILATIIFNLLSIVALTPLALRGVPYRLMDTARLQRNILLACGGGGLVAPFIGIKVIDLVLVGLGLV